MLIGSNCFDSVIYKYVNIIKKMRTLKNLIWINVISLLVFISVLLGVLYNFGFARIDFIVNSFMANITNGFLTNFSIAVSFIFDINSMIIISLVLSAYLWIKYSKNNSIFFILTIMLGGGIVYILKNLVQRARPLNALLIENNSAFPSGHATIAVVFFGALTYLILNKNKSRNLKLASIIISIFMVLFICFTRLYLNVHWFSDVFGGIAIGTFILTGCIFLKEFFNKK